MIKKRNGDQEMEDKGKSAYELGFADGKAQQPRLELIFSESCDNKFYNKGWQAGYAYNQKKQP